MSAIELPKHCAIDGFSQALADARVLGGEWKSAVLRIPERGFLHCSALAFLCAWGRQQRKLGREILIRGDESAIQHLVRLNLHEHLGIAYRRNGSSHDQNPSVPLHLISNEQDMTPAAAAIDNLVKQHFDNAASFRPALRWAINEILDNVLRHADAVEPGAVYSEYFPREHRLDVAVCDLGRGIRASLSESTYLYSDGHAITQAVRRGVTRSEDIGQGNGLAGVLEIVKRNRGALTIWTGDAVYKVIKGEEKGFVQIPKLPGTGVAFSLDTRTPVELTDTWIAGRGAEFLKTEAPRPASGIDVAAECSNTSMRSAAQRLRERILENLAQTPQPLTLDFTSVESTTSSFLDELLGRLVRELGSEEFHKKVRITGMSELVERMANVVVNQRMKGLTGFTTDSPEDQTK